MILVPVVESPYLISSSHYAKLMDETFTRCHDTLKCLSDIKIIDLRHTNV